jgi:hypothetical protein
MDGMGIMLRGATELTGPGAGSWLVRIVEATGQRLVAHRLVRIHHRPGRKLARVDEAVIEACGEVRAELLVTHLSGRPFPTGTRIVELDGITVAAWTYPDDPYLPGLVPAIDTGHLEDLTAVTGGVRGRVQVVRRAYRPTRRAVLEVRVDEPTGVRSLAFLKVLRTGRARRVAAVHDRLAGAVPVPEVLDHPHPDVLALAPIPGISLRRALALGQPVPAAEQLVGLSLSLAAIPLDDATATDPRSFADPATHVRAVRRDLPDLAPEVDDLVASIATMAPQPSVTVHGDLHGGQVLVDRGMVSGVLDLDGVGAGWLAHDAGNLLAHLGALSARAAGRRDVIDAFTARVAGAFAEVVDPAALAHAEAGSWLALAASAHRTRDEELVRERIRRARTAIGR